MSSSRSPRLRVPSFDEPWVVTSIGMLGAIKGGLSGKSGDDFGSGAPFLTYRQVYENPVVPSDGFGKVEVADGERQLRLQRGDVIFTASSETPQDVGMSSVVTHDPRELYLNSFCFALRPDHRVELREDFAVQLFRSPAFRRSVASIAQGSTRYNIGKSDFAKIEVAIPGAAEQERVAEFLGALDSLLTLSRERLAVLARFRDEVARRLLSGSVHFSAADGSSYSDWRTERVDAVFGDIDDRVGTRQGLVTYSISAGVGFVSQREKFGGDISGEQASRYIVLGPGQFAYNRGSSKAYRFGCVYPNDLGFEIAVPNVFIAFETRPGFESDFYKHYFRHRLLDRQLRRIISSSARLDGLLNVAKENFYGLTIAVPGIDEQKRISGFLNQLDERVDVESQAVALMSRIKREIAARMFS